MTSRSSSTGFVPLWLGYVSRGFPLTLVFAFVVIPSFVWTAPGGLTAARRGVGWLSWCVKTSHVSRSPYGRSVGGSWKFWLFAWSLRGVGPPCCWSITPVVMSLSANLITTLISSLRRRWSWVISMPGIDVGNRFFRFDPVMPLALLSLTLFLALTVSLYSLPPVYKPGLILTLGWARSWTYVWAMPLLGVRTILSVPTSVAITCLSSLAFLSCP